MTTTADGASTNQAKFQRLLRELFQFDCADLDFGIYRIMNHKRDAVERFISEQLPDFVAAELDSGPLAQQAQAAAELVEAARAVRENLSDDAIDDDGVLAEQHRNSNAGRRYLAAQSRASEGSRGRDAVEAAIYNHLYAFFSRYYDEGDFISRRRYSRNQRYAIPYNGEEVYLHWANSDQYYVKTDEHFRNYTWKAPNGVTVNFRLTNADVEQNNVKGDRRFFIPRVSETEWDQENAVITIPFEYRPLSGNEATTYGRSNQQDKILAAAVSEIPQQLRDYARALAALDGGHWGDGNGPVGHLEHHLRRYVRRNNSDFFIHKNLAAFLNRELDFYLKNEVLNLDNLAVAGQDMAEGWFQQMRLTKAVGGKIIDFLAQIEDFQKMLWEKRKFVTETQYCITMGSVGLEFYSEISANEAQWDEWIELFGVDGSDRSEALLRANPTLVLDTKNFDTEFTDRLLASFDELEDMIDGLLLHSENWHALRLLEEKYREGVKCIYIDPPFNTAASEILYKNNYKHSTWASLIGDRLSISRSYLQTDGALAFAINDAELKLALGVLEKSFYGYEIQPVVVNHYPGSGSGRGNVSSTHEYNLMVVPENQSILVGAKRNGGFRTRNLRRSGQGENNFRWGRPNSFFAILIDPVSLEIKGMEEAVLEGAPYPTDKTKEGLLRIYPIGQDGSERVWSRNQKSATQLWQSGLLECTSTNTIVHHIKNEGRKVLTSVWLDAKFNAVVHGTNLLKDILGRAEAFSYPKSIFTVRTAIDAMLDQNTDATVLDYFAGSGTTGHAVINLNREDDGKRKFILVEMGDYFDNVLLPRIKKVTFTPNWTNGTPQRPPSAEEAERSPRIVKYIRMESYEDALDSIEFDEGSGQLLLADPSDEYLLKYMLSWETRDSDTLLNPARLTSPFSYRLRVHANGEKRERTVDLPETFNYLLGLKVRKRKALDDAGRRYLVFRGETRAAPGRKVTVIWRETEGWTDYEFARDRDYVARKNLAGDADTVYVNGDSAIPNARPIEPMFKARMFAGVNA